MSSDLQKSEELEPKKASRLILHHEIAEAMDALERPAGRLFVSGLSAGLDVGFSLLLMAAMWTQFHEHLAPPLVHLLMANMYAVGFIFVVLGRSELFTEQTTLAVMPVLSGDASIKALGRLWGIVYVSNLLGGAGFAGIAVLSAAALHTSDMQAFGEIAHPLVSRSAAGGILDAILAGWLMGLLSWLVAAGRDTISQLLLVWLITTAIGFLTLSHVVVGSVEVLAGAFARQGVSALDVGHFLLWTTLGNAIGGALFVALIKYGHARPDHE